MQICKKCDKLNSECNTLRKQNEIMATALIKLVKLAYEHDMVDVKEITDECTTELTEAILDDLQG